MTRLLSLLWRGLQALSRRRPTAGRVIACLAVLGLAGLSYVGGAAVMYFRLPSSGYLDKAFTGAKAWQQRGRSTLPLLPAGSNPGQDQLGVDTPGKTCDGFTLYTTTEGPRAALLDMRGNVVHRWELPFSRAWPRAGHVRGGIPDAQIHWFRCHLYPNGDLLAAYHADGDTPYGYGLAKLDKDSRLLWTYSANAHHGLDVGEDGTIYTLTQKLVGTPPEGLDFLPRPYIADHLVLLSPRGRELASVPLLEAFRDSPYALLLDAVNREPGSVNVPPPGMPAPPGFPGVPPGFPKPPEPPKPDASLSGMTGDILHANSVKVLRRDLAARFPLFKPGQVLISFRHLDALAVVDPATRAVAWAARGPWRMQHDAAFLDNGRLLLFDNLGSPRGSRVLEYDPGTQAVPWAYASDGAPFTSLWRGATQRLANGNTLIVDADRGRLFEVTPGKEVVWDCFRGFAPAPAGQTAHAHALTGARRYAPNELTFLKGGARARP